MDGSRYHRIESLIEYNTTEMSLSQLACESGKATVVSNAVDKCLFYGRSSCSMSGQQQDQ